MASSTMVLVALILEATAATRSAVTGSTDSLFCEDSCSCSLGILVLVSTVLSAEIRPVTVS